MKLPTEVNILGVKHSITYVDNPAEVDRDKRKSLWGQIDYWTRSIRIYKNDRPVEDIFESILHEIIHGIEESLHLEGLSDENNCDNLDILALALTDVFFRNGWLEIENG